MESKKKKEIRENFTLGLIAIGLVSLIVILIVLSK